MAYANNKIVYLFYQTIINIDYGMHKEQFLLLLFNKQILTRTQFVITTIQIYRSLEPGPQLVLHQQLHHDDDLDGAHDHVRHAQD